MSSKDFRRFCQTTENAQPSPIELFFHPQSEIYLTRNTTIKFTLRSLMPRDPDSDAKSASLFFHWEHWKTCTRSELLLLHHTPHGLRKVPVLPACSPEDIECIVIDDTVYARGVTILGPDATTTSHFWITPNYLKAMRPGEIYTLLWPGKVMHVWSRGVPQQHKDSILRPRYLTPRLFIPGGAHITFTAKSEERVWPERAEVEAKFGYFEANVFEEEWRRKRRRSRNAIKSTEVTLP